MKTVSELAIWCLLNRRGNAFKDSSLSGIAYSIGKAIDDNAALCVTGEKGEILGMVCAHRDEERKVLFVSNIISIRPGIIKQMVSYFLKNFPSYTLEGVVGKRVRHFNNPQKLYNRL